MIRCETICYCDSMPTGCTAKFIYVRFLVCICEAVYFGQFTNDVTKRLKSSMTTEAVKFRL